MLYPLSYSPVDANCTTYVNCAAEPKLPHKPLAFSPPQVYYASQYIYGRRCLVMQDTPTLDIAFDALEPALAIMPIPAAPVKLEYHPTIHDLPADERPRERLVRYGPRALSAAELLA